jgi:cell division protein FtsN
VEKGETLYSVLRRQYGQANTTLLEYVLLSNQEISDPHRVSPGVRVRVPSPAEESLVRPSSSGEYRVHLGTFAKKELAERFKAAIPLSGRSVQIEECRVFSPETWHRVFAAGYRSREEALQEVMVLRKKGVLPLFFQGPPGPSKTETR